MSNQDSYITLISSLPASERLFIQKQPPLSRLRLERRLKDLSREDASTLSLIESLVAWQHYTMQHSDEQIINQFVKSIKNIQQQTLKDIVSERMELRTAMAALRLRKAGMPAPTGKWGLGRWTKKIEANWADPNFSLESSLPWLSGANVLINNQDPLALERYILEVTYRQLQRHAGKHNFDFEAVVIYVLKWHIFDRWFRSNTQAAAKRFESLAQVALGKYADSTVAGEFK